MLTFIYFIFYSAPQNKFPGQMYLDNKYCDSDSENITPRALNITEFHWIIVSGEFSLDPIQTLDLSKLMFKRDIKANLCRVWMHAQKVVSSVTVIRVLFHLVLWFP